LRRQVGVLLAHELRLVLRDRRACVAAFVLPLVIVPATLLAVRVSTERQQQARAVALYRYALAGAGAEGLSLALQSLPDTGEEEGARLVEVPAANPQASLTAGRIEFFLEVVDSGASAPRVRIHFLGDRDVSRDAAARAESLLREAWLTRTEDGLRARGVSVDARRIFPVQAADVATPAARGGAAVGRILTALVVFLMLSGSAGAAMDMLAGERERGTLETLLASAAPRSAIVAAKHLAILAMALASTLLQVASLLAWLSLGLLRLPAGFTVPISTATLPALLLLFLPLAALVAACLLLVSGRVGSYREAQLFLLPLFLGGLAPALAAFLPGVPLRSALVLLPVANVSLAVREVLAGRFDWPMLVLAAAATGAAAAWATRLSTRALSNEERLLGFLAEPLAPSGSAAFERRVVAWFAGLWALLFLASGLLPGLRSQLLFNQLGVFLGLPLAMAWRHRLRPPELFALRPVRAPVVVGALLAAAPAVVAAQGVFRLANRLLPVSSGLLQEFSQALLPGDVSGLEQVLLVALLPALCEELAFRGALVYGLRRRLHPALLALVTGAVFGFFHFAYFRLVPTAFLGVVLASLVLLTGSILPGMLLHAGYNASTLWAAKQGFPLDRLDPWLYAASALALALCFWVVYRCRTPYPGLRPWRAPATVTAGR
jgi:sodium transport system permease protein